MFDLNMRPQFTVAVPPKLLQEGYLVTFSNRWAPSQFGAFSDKTFRVDATNQVPHIISHIIPENDYRDIDLSNGDDEEQESIYPNKTDTLEEVTIGFSPGNYLVHVYVPASRHIHSLQHAGMTPDVSSTTLRYLGARKPQDSPAEDPRMTLYLVDGLAPIILRTYVLPGVDYEKCVLNLTINKLKLLHIPEPTAEQKRIAKVIRYYDELR